MCQGAVLWSPASVKPPRESRVPILRFRHGEDNTIEIIMCDAGTLEVHCNNEGMLGEFGYWNTPPEQASDIARSERDE